MTLLGTAEQEHDYAPREGLTIAPGERVAELEFRGMSTVDAMREVYGSGEDVSQAQGILLADARANIQKVIEQENL